DGDKIQTGIRLTRITAPTACALGRCVMTRTSIIAIIATAAFILAASAQRGAARPLPPGDAKAIVETACTTCHAINLITGTGHTPEDWKLLVERMVSAGAEVPKDKIP